MSCDPFGSSPTESDQEHFCGPWDESVGFLVAFLLEHVIDFFSFLTSIFVSLEDYRHIQFLQSIYPIEIVDVSDRFQDALVGITDPEQKRKIIGELFVRTFEAHTLIRPMQTFDVHDEEERGICWLAQGTIYPDIIESGGRRRSNIKSHHNVGGLPKRLLGLRLLEPLRRLFKDEVRALGAEMKVPDECVFRHPFPGPGLAIRILGDVTKDRIEILQKADDIFLSVLKKYDYYERVSQSFAVLLPTVNTVGLKGDARIFGPVIALRCVDTLDFMTANWSHLPYELLGEASREITNQIPQISRVVFDITTKPPSTIEWE
jgi:GMP synthase (glutamine-hydrolysing)